MSPDVFSRKPKQASKSAFDLTQRNGVLWDFFPQIIHPCFELSTLSVTFTIKISTYMHTCKRKNNFVCTAITHTFVFVFEELARIGGLCAGADQRLHSSKLKSSACADRMPLCSFFALCSTETLATQARQEIFYVFGCSIMWAILPIREWRYQDIDQVLLHEIIFSLSAFTSSEVLVKITSWFGVNCRRQLARLG